MPATEIEAYEDGTSMTVESDLARFLDSVLQRPYQISQAKVNEEIWSSISSLSLSLSCLLRIPWDSSLNINAYDKETLDNLSSAFSDVHKPRSNV